MRRLFYPKNNIVGLWMEQQSNLTRQQDSYFLKSFLASLRSKFPNSYALPYKNIQQSKIKQYSQESLHKIHQQILDYTIQQQQVLATNYYLQPLHLLLATLNKHSSGTSMISTADQFFNSQTKDLVDPDKFPIWDLRQKISSYVSLWGRVMGRIRYDLGFQMIVRQSAVQHIQGGNGVYIVMKKNYQNSVLPIGTFLGFVPGTVYQSPNDFRKMRLKHFKQYEIKPYYLQFPSGKILQFTECLHNTQSRSQPQPIKVQPTYKNPFALGHIINHPAPGRSANVSFIQLNIPVSFFPKYLMQYLPYNYEIQIKKEKNKTLPIFAIISIAQIKHNDELYANYFQNHIYQYKVENGQSNKYHLQQFPEWLIQPDPVQIADYLVKQQYQYPPKIYWSAVQRAVMKSRQKSYAEYMSKVHYKPQKTIYQDQKHKITVMARKIQDQHQSTNY